MKIGICPLLMLPLMAGCISSAPKAPTSWTIELNSADLSPVAAVSASRGDAVRITGIDVRAPYNGTRLAVLRPDGSIAFDAFNVFAASPTLLLRGATYDAAEMSGLFEKVVPSSSGASARYAMEIYVTELALDCRIEGRRTAKVSLLLMLLEGRNIVGSIRGEGEAEAEADYSAAFSMAYGRAMQGALSKLKLK